MKCGRCCKRIYTGERHENDDKASFDDFFQFCEEVALKGAVNRYRVYEKTSADIYDVRLDQNHNVYMDLFHRYGWIRDLHRNGDITPEEVLTKEHYHPTHVTSLTFAKRYGNGKTARILVMHKQNLLEGNMILWYAVCRLPVRSQ